MAAAAVLASVFAAALAGQVAVSGKYASYSPTPDCSASDPTIAAKGGSLDRTTTDGLGKIQAELHGMQHPSPFTGTLEVGSLESFETDRWGSSGDRRSGSPSGFMSRYVAWLSLESVPPMMQIG